HIRAERWKQADGSVCRTRLNNSLASLVVLSTHSDCGTAINLAARSDQVVSSCGLGSSMFVRRKVSAIAPGWEEISTGSQLYGSAFPAEAKAGCVAVIKTAVTP